MSPPIRQIESVLLNAINSNAVPHEKPLLERGGVVSLKDAMNGIFNDFYNGQMKGLVGHKATGRIRISRDDADELKRHYEACVANNFEVEDNPAVTGLCKFDGQVVAEMNDILTFCQNELARIEGVDSCSVSGSLRSLEERRFVVRERCQRTGRQGYAMTLNGQNYLRDVAEGYTLPSSGGEPNPNEAMGG